MDSTSTKTFRFIDAPPERNMRKKSPESAPRLYEWLVDNGYVEPVTSYGRGKRSASDSNRGGGLGGGTRKKKKLPF